METKQTIETKQTRTYTIDAVDTALALLMLIANQPDLGLSEIARQAGHSKARVFRLIKTLEGRGLVIQSVKDRSYRLGYAALILGGAAARQTDLVQTGRPILAQLSDTMGETAQLRVLQGEQSMCIAAWEPTRDLKVNALVGRRRPLYRGTNKILLAYAEPAFQQALLATLAHSAERESPGQTPVVLAELRRQLDKIRLDGYWVSRGDMIHDLSGVGAPVFGPDGHLVAAINISAPSGRLENQLERAVSEVVAAAARFSTLLGAPGVTSNTRPF